MFELKVIKAAILMIGNNNFLVILFMPHVLAIDFTIFEIKITEQSVTLAYYRKCTLIKVNT